MSRKLPEELAPVLARTGRHWPQADEDGLRRMAAVWREFGTEADRLGKRGGDSARRVTGENSGKAVEAFGEYWQAFSGRGRGHLDDAHSAAGLVAAAFDKAAGAVEGCKADIVATLTELAAELKKAEEYAAKAKKAAAAIEAATRGGESGGLLGELRQGIGSVAAEVRAAADEKIAEAMVAVAVEAAKLKIGGLLDELGRAMKAGLQSSLKEPAVIALLRIAPGAAFGGAHGGVHQTAAGRGGAPFDPVAAGLPAALAEPGVLGAGGSGLTLVTGPDGTPVVGVSGLAVKLDEHGQPVLDKEGNPVIVRADGTPVADSEGLLVVAGPDGKPVVGVADLTVEVDAHGKVVLDKNGQPLLTDKDGKPVTGVPLTEPGAEGSTRPLDRHGNPIGPDGTVQTTTPGAAQDPAPGAPKGPVDAVTGAAGSVLPGSTGVAVTAQGPDGNGGVQVKTGPVTVSAGDGGGGGGGGAQDGGGGSTSRPEPQPRPHSSGQHGGGGGGSVATAAPVPAEAAPTPAPAPSAAGHGTASVAAGPVSVRTDSVLAPPAPGAEAATGPAHQTGRTAESAGPYATPPSNQVTTGPVTGTGPYVTGPYTPAGPAHSGPTHTGPVAGTPVAAGPVTGTPLGATPVAGNPAAGTPGQTGPGAGQGQPGQSAQPGHPGGHRAGAGAPAAGATGPHPVTVPGPAPVPPPPAAAPVYGPTPGRPEGHHHTEGRRRSDGATEGAGLAWGVPPIATAHALALQLALRALRPTTDPDTEPARLRTIADSRPYGLPGGLDQVDPEHQAEVERRVPKDADGLPARHPDPAAGGWAEAVNAGGWREPGRANNSLDIALSAVETFTGRPTCAAPRLPGDGEAGERGGRDRAERELGAPFRDLGDGDDAFGRLAAELRRAGHGSQAVLLTLDGFGRPHAWNAVNHQDAVSYLDHQTGDRAGSPLHPADQGLWAIALAPDGRPLDLAGSGAR